MIAHSHSSKLLLLLRFVEFFVRKIRLFLFIPCFCNNFPLLTKHFYDGITQLMMAAHFGLTNQWQSCLSIYLMKRFMMNAYCSHANSFLIKLLPFINSKKFCNVPRTFFLSVPLILPQYKLIEINDISFQFAICCPPTLCFKICVSHCDNVAKIVCMNTANEIGFSQWFLGTSPCAQIIHQIYGNVMLWKGFSHIDSNSHNSW